MAGAFLAVWLCAASGDLTAGLGRGIALACVCQLANKRLMHDGLFGSIPNTASLNSVVPIC